MAADSLRAQPDQQHERTGRSRPGLGHGLKQELAAAHPDNGPAYTAGKRELVGPDPRHRRHPARTTATLNGFGDLPPAGGPLGGI
jgi:hypothetical protein